MTVALAAMFAMVSAGTGPASAQGPGAAAGLPVVHGEQSGGTPVDGLAADAASYAAARGVGIAAARQALKTQKALGNQLAALARQFPESYAGGWVEHSPRVHAVARFAGAVPAAAYAATQGQSGMTLRGGAEESLAALQRRTDAVHADLVAQGRSQVTTSYDVKTGTVEASLQLPAGEQAASRAKLMSALPASARRDGVAVEFVPGEVSGDEHTRGGARTPGDSGGLCTTGFSVARNGVYGFVTAGHCANARDYQEPQSGGLRYDAPYRAQHRGDWGDFQWHTTSHAEYAEFYTSDTGYRPVNGYDGSISTGDYVCKYGRTTGYGCSDVYRVNVTVTVDGFTYRRLVAVEDYITSGGDSGGPWFLVYDATGVHKGYTTIWFSKRSIFSPIFYIDDALGLALVVK
ncbi:MAG: S1 family peptidase [Micromonosporaceae bacterium]